MGALHRLVAAASLLAPGALIVYLAFNAGGFFAGSTATAAVILALLLILRVLTAEEPFAGVSLPFAVAAAALALFAVWTLVSAAWSDAPARALIEFGRVLLYLFAFLLTGFMARTPERLAWLIRVIAAAGLLVGAISWTTRVASDVWPISPNLLDQRLSYPLTYWNALGILMAVTLVLTVHLTCSEREPRAVRVIAAAAVPLLASTLLLTFSRGPIGAAILGLIAYVVVARPRGIVGGLLSAGPAAAIALVATYDADKLAQRYFFTPDAQAQGHHVALVVLASAAGAAVLRFLLLGVDARLARLALPAVSRKVVAGSAVAVLVLAIAAAAAADVPHRLDREYRGFVEGNTVSDSGTLRTRLTDPGNNGRLDHWRVARDSFEEHPFHGTGAGTYRLAWLRDRPIPFTVNDAHSLYLEVAGELGVVGFVLLAVTLLTIIGGFAFRARGPNRALFAALFAAALTWGVHAAVDWDWEMPAVTLWLFAAGGAALAAPAGLPGALRGSGRSVRLVMAAFIVFVAATPLLIAVSQSRLDDAVTAFKRGDCPRTIDRALASASALPVRPDPWELIGYCDVKLGSGRLGVTALENAVDRDRGNWELHYGLSLVRGAVGLDPRAEAREALRMNPLEPRARTAAEAFRGPRRTWRRAARGLPLPVR